MATNDDPSGTGTGYSEDVEEVLKTLVMVRSSVSVRTAPYTNERLRGEQELDIQRTKSVAVIPQKKSDGIVLVDWYTTNHSANPHNWSSEKKGFVVFILCYYTWSVYCAGSIYDTTSEGIVEHFGVSPIAATLGLSLSIQAYGVGDLLFSPITEISSVGRNHVYYLTFIVFWVLSFPTAIVDSFSGLLA
jgi:DHA1 family multidrug resistance protein-like MFS transporter